MSGFVSVGDAGIVAYCVAPEYVAVVAAMVATGS